MLCPWLMLLLQLTLLLSFCWLLFLPLTLPLISLTLVGPEWCNTVVAPPGIGSARLYSGICWVVVGAPPLPTVPQVLWRQKRRYCVSGSRNRRCRNLLRTRRAPSGQQEGSIPDRPWLRQLPNGRKKVKWMLVTYSIDSEFLTFSNTRGWA